MYSRMGTILSAVHTHATRRLRVVDCVHAGSTRTYLFSSLAATVTTISTAAAAATGAPTSLLNTTARR